MEIGWDVQTPRHRYFVKLAHAHANVLSEAIDEIRANLYEIMSREFLSQIRSGLSDRFQSVGRPLAQLLDNPLPETVTGQARIPTPLEVGLLSTDQLGASKEEARKFEHRFLSHNLIRQLRAQPYLGLKRAHFQLESQ